MIHPSTTRVCYSVYVPGHLPLNRVRGALDRNPTYIVATYVAGATSAPADPSSVDLAADPGGRSLLCGTDPKAVDTDGASP